MISMDCNHDDIEEFIDAKRNTDKLEGCNISVRCDNQFMKDSQCKDYGQRRLMMKLAENNWDYAEPGILFWDNINEYNLLSEYIKAGEFEYAGVNPCLVGDTLIQTTEGEIPIKELVGKQPYVYCMDDEGKLIIKQASKVWKTRENANLVKVTHHRGEIICTPDHMIYTTNRGWVKAKDLKPKDKLNGLGRSMKDETHCCIKLSTDKKYYPEHRFIASFFTDVKGKDVHHLNENPLDNRWSNLEVLPHGKHSIITNTGKTHYAGRNELGQFVKTESKKRRDTLQVNKDNTGKNFIVKNVEILNYTEDVYDMTVPEVHNFIADSILVHNCAEEPLPAGGSCLLGAINLSEFVVDPFTDHSSFDIPEFKKAVRIAVVALNEVLDEGLPLHPLEMQRQTVADWRQIGLGIMGFADMLIKVGIPYGSADSLRAIDMIGKAMNEAGINTSVDLAVKKGSFPKFDADKILKSKFMEHMSQATKCNVTAGLRNSQLFTIAPTGTISTMLGVSGGVEPLFDIEFTRTTKSLHGEDVTYKVKMPIVEKCLKAKKLDVASSLPEEIVWSKTIDPISRVDVQAKWQEYIDASISSTVNLPESATVQDVFDLYQHAWFVGCKGLTIFRDGCARTAILNSTTKEEKEEPVEKTVNTVDTDIENCIAKGTKLSTGCGSLWITCYFHKETGQLCHIFLDKGSTGGCNSFMNGLSRMISLAGKKGASIDDIIEQLNSTIACPSYAVAKATKNGISPGKGCPSAIGKAIKKLSKEFKKEYLGKTANIIKQEEKQEKPKCPTCGAELTFTGGCNVCPNCGWSKCD